MITPGNQSFIANMREAFFIKRFNSLAGKIVMGLLGVLIAFLAVQFGKIVPIGIIAFLAGVIFLVACFKYPEFAYYAYVFSILYFTLLIRIFAVPIPLGVAIEGVGYIAVLSVFLEQFRKRTSMEGFWKTPISVMLLVLFLYFVLELFNPEAHSVTAWFNYVRKQIIYLLFYTASFFMLDSYEKIKRYIKMWIAVALAACAWGFKQQWFGFTAYEDFWINSDPMIRQLLFQGGMFRKFSLLPDPATFGMLCTGGGLLTLVLAMRDTVKKRRNWLFFFSAVQIVCSGYSGTRTCTLMLIAGLLIYFVFTLNEKKTLRLLLFSVLGFLFLLFGPFKNNLVVIRMKTTFEGTKDPSAIVREVNRKRIQPYIQARPFGGGLNTVEMEGQVFYPNHPLSTFTPDSGYLKFLLQNGWIGFALQLIIYFLVLHRGIVGFYTSRRPEIKSLYIAITICLFSLMIGHYSQLAIAQYPHILFFYSSIVVLYKLKEYDKSNTDTTAKDNL